MLRELLAIDVYKLFLIFARLGAALMIMPGFSSTTVFVRARLIIALFLAVLLLPLLSPSLPPQPVNPISLFLLLAGEITIGLFFGLLMQVFMTPLDLAGNFMGYSVGLTNAFVFDTNVEQQSQILAGFLSMVGVTLVFLTNSHLLMLRGLVGTYELFRPGQGLPLDDFVQVFVRSLGSSFKLGMELAAPLVVFSLAFNTALGLMNRLVPQMQVFFVAMPLQILGGIFLMGVSLSALMLWFLSHFNEGVGAFFLR